MSVNGSVGPNGPVLRLSAGLSLTHVHYSLGALGSGGRRSLRLRGGALRLGVRVLRLRIASVRVEGEISEILIRACIDNGPVTREATGSRRLGVPEEDDRQAWLGAHVAHERRADNFQIAEQGPNGVNGQ